MDAIFTHLLTADERRTGLVAVTPDLEFVAAGAGDDVEFEVEWGSRETVLWRGPVGWLERFAAGDVLAFVHRDGEIHVAVADVTPDPDLVALLRESFVAACGEDGTAVTIHAIAAVIAQRPAAFAVPRPALRDLLTQAGLSYYGDELAPADFDWDALWDARRDRHGAQLAADNDLDDLDGALLSHLTVAHEVLLGRGVIDDDVADRASVAMTSPMAVDAFIDARGGVLGRHADLASVAGVIVLARMVIERERLHPPAGAHVLLGRCAEWIGDALAHEEHATAALRIDATFEPALEDAAMIANERGKARAVELMGRLTDACRFDGSIADRFVEPGLMHRGRNERCGCGMRAKYKDCCLAANGYFLSDRVPWVWQKAMFFAKRPRRFGAVWNLALAAAGVDDFGAGNEPPAREWALMEAAVRDELEALLTLSLFEGGAMAAFAAERGPLLPPDELWLLGDWVGQRHRLWRVDQVDGAAVRFVDVIGGEQVTLGLPDLAAERPVGSHFVAVVVPVPRGRYLWHRGVAVAPDDIDAVTACLRATPSAEALAAAVLRPALLARRS